MPVIAEGPKPVIVNHEAYGQPFCVPQPMVADAMGAEGPVVIAWEHEAILPSRTKFSETAPRVRRSGLDPDSISYGSSIAWIHRAGRVSLRGDSTQLYLSVPIEAVLASRPDRERSAWDYRERRLDIRAQLRPRRPGAYWELCQLVPCRLG